MCCGSRCWNRKDLRQQGQKKGRLLGEHLSPVYANSDVKGRQLGNVATREGTMYIIEQRAYRGPRCLWPAVERSHAGGRGEVRCDIQRMK